MKTFIVLFFTALVFTLNAQVTLDKTYNFSASVTKLETSGYKYYIMDVPAEQCRIYNTDHSLFKTINCNIPSGFFLSDIKFVSEKLFDNDPGVELLCTFYKYNSANDYYDYDSKIINDDGSQIQFINGALYNYINKTNENTYKLFSYCYDLSVFPEKVWTNIYNLPGAPVVASAQETNPKNFELNAFPNPANETVKVEYQLPQNVFSGKLFLFDNNGREINQFKIDNHTNHLLLNVSDYNTGVYYYFVEAKNIRTPSKKLVIQ